MPLVLGIYVAALIFGGGLLALSVFGGGDEGDSDADGGIEGGDLDADAGADLDADAGADADVDAGADGSSGDDVHAASDFLTIFVSLRFWTFLLGFGGLTGLLLTVLGVAEPIGMIASAGMGAVCGTVATLAVRALSRGQISSSLGQDDWIGRSGRVVLPVSAERAGKIRLEFEHEVKDVMALAAGDEGELAIGQDVIVVEMADGVAKVTAAQPSGEGAARAAARRQAH